MSFDIFYHPKYVKFNWPVTFCSHYHSVYSDQFKIDGLVNVGFNMMARYYTGSKHFVSLTLKRSSSETAHVTINISMGEVKSTVEIHDWKDFCYFDYLYISEKMIQKFSVDSGTTCIYFKTTITCEIFWKSIIQNPDHNNLFNEMKNFYNSQDFSDVTLVVGEVKIPSHKLILSAHSPVFSRMLQTEMRESKENIINIENVDAEIILEMLHYFYKGETKASNNSEIALKILKVADMYQITKLKDICERTLVSTMSVGNVLYILDTADDYNAIYLRNSAINFIVRSSKILFATNKFKQLFYGKPDLIFELMSRLSSQ